MIRAFAEFLIELLTKLSGDEKWIGKSSFQKALTIGHSILNDELVDEKRINRAIKDIRQENPEEEDALILALLAVLYSELEESMPQSVKYFEKLAKISGEATQLSINNFLSVMRVTELHDFSNLLHDGLVFLEMHKDDVNARSHAFSGRVTSTWCR